MKLLIMCFFFTLTLTSAFAQELHCEPVVNEILDQARTDRINGIIKASCVLNTVANFEKEKQLDCIQPKANQINWACSNGGGCGFLLDITCVSRIGPFETNNKIVRLSIGGSETAQGVVFDSATNFVQEYEPLKRK